MGNSCCMTMTTQRSSQFDAQMSNQRIMIEKICKSLDFEDYSCEDEMNVPIQQHISISAVSKVDLDTHQTTFNTKRESVFKATLASFNKLPDDTVSRNSTIRISQESFVTLKHRRLEDHYQIGKQLGKGSYGCVCKVTHIQTGLVRAMKQIKKSSIVLEDQQKILSEITVLKTLDHPNIVKVYEFFQDDNCYYIISEYLQGGELFQRIRNMQFSERTSADIMCQILRAVAHCHEKQIVHRDIKPENIIFSQSGDNNLKLIDFGASRYFTTQLMSKRMGTPYYIAPEILNREYNEKVDIWSCGVIMYVLLCGYPPFGGSNDQEILKKVKIGKYSFDHRDWKGVSKDAMELVTQMICLDPKQRISAKQALNHPWICSNVAPNTKNIVALNNLIKFETASSFKKAILSYIVNQTLAQQEIKELQQTFMALDTNKDGLLNEEELIQGYEYLLHNRQMALAKVKQIISHVDINFSGKVDYSEFIMAAINQEKLVSIAQIKQTFKMLDLNNDGILQREELEEVMGKLGEEIWSEYLLECDQNHDGKISEEEFTKILITKY